MEGEGQQLFELAVTLVCAGELWLGLGSSNAHLLENTISPLWSSLPRLLREVCEDADQ